MRRVGNYGEIQSLSNGGGGDFLCILLNMKLNNPSPIYPKEFLDILSLVF